MHRGTGPRGRLSPPERQAHLRGRLANMLDKGQVGATRTQSCIVKMLPHHTRGFCRKWGAVHLKRWLFLFLFAPL